MTNLFDLRSVILEIKLNKLFSKQKQEISGNDSLFQIVLFPIFGNLQTNTFIYATKIKRRQMLNVD